MNVDDGSIRELAQSKVLKDLFKDVAIIGNHHRPLGWEKILQPNEVFVNEPTTDCTRCGGKGSIPKDEGTRPERRRAEKKGLPIWAKYLPCPECNPD